jgi:hypothetical protein
MARCSSAQPAPAYAPSGARGFPPHLTCVAPLFPVAQETEVAEDFTFSGEKDCAVANDVEVLLYSLLVITVVDRLGSTYSLEA